MNIGNKKPLLYYFAIIIGVLVIVVGNDVIAPKFTSVKKAPTPTTYAAPTAPLVITATPTGGVLKAPSTTLKATSSASVTAVPTK